MAFFNSQGKINLDQTDIRISAENGLSFKPDQTIGIYIPPSVKYFSGKDSYLQWDCLLSGDDNNPTRLALDSGIGGQSLISSLRIYAGNRGTLLEENTQYSTYVAVKYDYSRTDTEQNKRFLTEGTGVYDPTTRGEEGSTKSLGNNIVHSPYFATINGQPGEGPNDPLVVSDAWTNAKDFVRAKMTLPLHCGVFANNDKVFPSLLTDGLYIEITLAGVRNTFRQMDSLTFHRRNTDCPIFFGITDAGASLQKNKGNLSNLVVLDIGNSVNSVQTCPFVVGERIGFRKRITPYTKAVLHAKTTITGIELNASGRVELTTTDLETDAGFAEDIVKDAWYVVSEALDNMGAGEADFAPTYEISNVEMVIHQISMPDSYEKSMLSAVKEKGGVIEFDIPSVQAHTHSTLKSDTQATIPLNIDYSRAKSILCVPTDATIYNTSNQTCGLGTYLQTKDRDAGASFLEDGILHSNRTGLEGCSNSLSAYSFFLNGKQVPSRDISTKKTSSKFGGIDANFLVELEKSLVSAGIPVNNFVEYNRNFVVGRMLALGEDAVFDGRGRSCRLNVRYEGTTADTQPSVNTLWKNFIFHHRKMVIKGDNISVEI